MKNQKILLKIGAGVAIVIVGYSAYKYIKLPNYAGSKTWNF